MVTLYIIILILIHPCNHYWSTKTVEYIMMLVIPLRFQKFSKNKNGFHFSRIYM